MQIMHAAGVLANLLIHNGNWHPPDDTMCYCSHNSQ